MSALRELIADRIRTSGPISFAEFMELSLYHPELGYYARAARQSGRAGDFFTSVDVGPMFGELLAIQLAEMLPMVRAAAGSEEMALDLVEAGAGNGRLARDVLDGIHTRDPQLYASLRLSLVERSPAARAQQVETLAAHAPLLAHSDGAMPESVSGVIYANELLDALPTHAVSMTESGLREIFIDLDRSASGEKFVERFEEPSTSRLAEYLARAGAEMRPGWRAEVNLAAEDWMKRAASALRTGFIVLIDYGHDEAELYGGSHAAGTLTAFSRHAHPHDFLQRPGETDLTTHVDLTAITRAALQEGLEVLGRLDQTYFVLGLAEMDELPLKRRLAMKTLLLPGGLGSTHKVLIFGKGVGTPRLKGLSYRVRMT